MRRVACALIVLVVSGIGATAATAPARPRLAVRPASPTAGAAATILVRGKLTGPIVVRLTTPRRTSARLRLRRVSRTLWRRTYSFVFPGNWTLAFKRTTRRVEVAPYPESTFVPPGAAGCVPPSPANAITREARGSGTLWALLESGTFADQHAAALDDVVGKETKIVWRMSGQGDLRLSAIAPDGAKIGPDSSEAHAGSSWRRPGDEWGSVFTFSKPGCWHLRAERDDGTADLWLLVRS
jgi:hypothetical protein